MGVDRSADRGVDRGVNRGVENSAERSTERGVELGVGRVVRRGVMRNDRRGLKDGATTAPSPRSFCCCCCIGTQTCFSVFGSAAAPATLPFPCAFFRPSDETCPRLVAFRHRFSIFDMSRTPRPPFRALSWGLHTPPVCQLLVIGALIRGTRESAGSRPCRRPHATAALRGGAETRSVLVPLSLFRPLSAPISECFCVWQAYRLPTLEPP